MRPRAPDPRGLMAGAASALCVLPCQAAVNSYRFLHVTIDTPWYIFLFLLVGIFAPFVLMVVLMWRNSARKRDQARARSDAARAAGPPPGGSPPA